MILDVRQILQGETYFYRFCMYCGYIPKSTQHGHLITPIMRKLKNYHIDGLVQEICNSIALTMELRLSCTNLSTYYYMRTHTSLTPKYIATLMLHTNTHTYLRFIVPDTASSTISQVGVVTSFTTITAVGMVPHLTKKIRWKINIQNWSTNVIEFSCKALFFFLKRAQLLKNTDKLVWDEHHHSIIIKHYLNN